MAVAAGEQPGEVEQGGPSGCHELVEPPIGPGIPHQHRSLVSPDSYVM